MDEEHGGTFIGEDGLDLNDSDAVQKWTQKKLAENANLDETFNQQLRANGMDPNESSLGKVDLSNLNGDMLIEFTQILTDLELREQQFKLRLATSSSGGTGHPHRIEKWKSL